MSRKTAQAIISKTREDYNRIAQYFNTTRAHVWPEFKYFRRFIKDDQNVLDWGCGNGRLIQCFKGKKAHYFGVDQSRELIKIARRNFASAVKEGRAKFFSVPGGIKKFPDNFFDLVFMISSLFHLPTPETRLALLEKVNRQMKAKAKLVILVWNLESDWAKEKMKKDWKKISANDYLIPWKSPDGQKICDRYYHHFTRAELKDLLSQAGFAVWKMEFMGNGTWSDNKGGRNLVTVAIKKAS